MFPRIGKYLLKLSGGYWSLEDAFVRLLPKSSKEEAYAEDEVSKAKQAEVEKIKAAVAQREANQKRREAAEQTPRVWTSADGKFTVEARFAGKVAKTVRLRKSDGATITLDSDKLSDADRQWIEDQAKKK